LKQAAKECIFAFRLDLSPDAATLFCLLAGSITKGLRAIAAHQKKQRTYLAAGKQAFTDIATSLCGTIASISLLHQH
jgi:hypothetical protein